MEHCQKHAAHEERMSGIDTAIGDAQDNIRLLAQGQHEIRERLARDERDIETLQRVLRDQEAHTKAITKLGIATEHMAEQVKEAITLLKDHDGRLHELERVPNEEIKCLLEDVKTRVDTLERAPGLELIEMAKQSKRKVAEMATSAIVGAVISAIALLPLLYQLLDK
jgi:hypothetical protein